MHNIAGYSRCKTKRVPAKLCTSKVEKTYHVDGFTKYPKVIQDALLDSLGIEREFHAAIKAGKSKITKSQLSVESEHKILDWQKHDASIIYVDMKTFVSVHETDETKTTSTKRSYREFGKFLGIVNTIAKELKIGYEIRVSFEGYIGASDAHKNLKLMESVWNIYRGMFYPTHYSKTSKNKTEMESNGTIAIKPTVFDLCFDDDGNPNTLDTILKMYSKESIKEFSTVDEWDMQFFIEIAQCYKYGSNDGVVAYC